MRTKISGILIAFAAATLRAQSPPPTPKFDVVSIKPCVLGDTRMGLAPSRSRLTLPCFPLLGLIRDAYTTFANGGFPASGHLAPMNNAPAWLDSAFYSIEATAAGDPGQTMMLGPMMQAVLEERFNLKIHSEMREGPVYALTVLKSGPRLQPAKEGNCAICKMGPVTTSGFAVRGVTLAEFSTRLSGRLDRNIIDETGIEGTFDFISLPMEGAAPPPPPPSGGAGGPALTDPVDLFSNIQTALRKFGLKLESTRGPGRIFIIDHIDLPAPN